MPPPPVTAAPPRLGDARPPVVPLTRSLCMSDRWRWSALVALVVIFGLSAAPARAQTCAAAWSPAQVYTAGNQASLNGINYTANFWTQGQDPSTNKIGRASCRERVKEPAGARAR